MTMPALRVMPSRKPSILARLCLMSVHHRLHPARQGRARISERWWTEEGRHLHISIGGSRQQAGKRVIELC